MKDKDGTELFEYEIEVVCSPKRIIYIAESEEEAQELFLDNNNDLDENDISVNKIKLKEV